MARLAGVFANEGAQNVGMGKEFYDKSLTARKYFDDAEKILELKVAKLCFLGPKEEQDLTPNAHYATFVCGVAAWELLVANKRRAEVVTGAGVGEIAALTAAECLPYGAALNFIYKRAQWIDAKVGPDKGRSLMVQGIPTERLSGALSREEGELHLTHRLAPDVQVVWGPREAAESLELELQGAPGVKVTSATTRGPLHTPLAAAWEADLEALLTACLAGAPLKNPKATVHRVSDGEYVGTPEGIRDILIRQYSRPVDWTQTVSVLTGRGYRTFVEMGPGKVYTTLVKRIDSNTRVANVEDVKSLSVALKVTS